MDPQRIVGVVVLLVGAVLLVLGLNASHSVADQVSNAFVGRFTHATMWYIIGGGALALLGLLMVLFGRRSKTA